jgi:hypothetical protein
VPSPSSAGGAQKTVPEPTPVIRPSSGQVQSAPAPDDDSPGGRVARLRAELAEAEAAAPAQPGTTRVKVEGPHESFTVAGITVGTDFAPVSDSLLTSFMRAAREAGVALTTEG